MSDQITCPNCKKSIPLSAAITHQIDEKYKQEIEELKTKSENERERLIMLSKKRIQEEKDKTAKEVEQELKIKIKEEMELKLKDTENESKELKDQNKEQQIQLLELTKGMRKLQDENRLKEIEMQKKLSLEQDKIRQEEKKRIEDLFSLKMLEKDKQISDTRRQIEELKRKMEQGSQQTQGEVMELAIEDLLKKVFPLDQIKEVPKGVAGADIIQVVKNNSGKVCGRIIWETKRTKNWSQGWIAKLKSDQRVVNAEVAVLVTAVLPDVVFSFGSVEGVWVCKFEFIEGIAHALRTQLMEVAIVKSSQQGQDGKKDMLYEYVTSIEFRHRVEAIIESFSSMQGEIEKERRWFTQKWAREEKNIRNVLDATIGMKGDLQSIMGKSIEEPKEMDALPENTDQEQLL